MTSRAVTSAEDYVRWRRESDNPRAQVRLEQVLDAERSRNAQADRINDLVAGSGPGDLIAELDQLLLNNATVSKTQRKYNKVANAPTARERVVASGTGALGGAITAAGAGSIGGPLVAGVAAAAGLVVGGIAGACATKKRVPLDPNTRQAYMEEAKKLGLPERKR